MDDKKMFKEVKIKKFRPIYATALTWLIYGLILPLYRITDLLICGGISVLAYFAAKRLIPEKTVLHPLTEDGGLNKHLMEIIDKGHAFIDELEQALERKGNKVVELILATQVREIIKAGRGMLEAAAKNPRSALELRTFIDYYFPTTLKLLNTYRDMADTDVRSENVQAIMDKIQNVMDTIVAAFNKQLDSMYSDKKLDIKTDIEVLKTVISSEGLND